MPAKRRKKEKKAIASSAAIYLIALALLLWAGLNLYQRYQFHQDWRNKQAIEEPATEKKSAAQAPKNTRQVADQHLFGEQLHAAIPVEITRAPATRLNLTLIGVIAAKEDGVSKVIIQIDKADVGVFSVGDSLPKGNATIERIEATQVLLRRNGKLESLAIIRPELSEEEGLGLRAKD
jgi:type II secretory pathway component PulC